MKTNIYLYDGSFISLLNLIKQLLTLKVVPLNIKELTYQPNLFEELINLEIKNDENIIEYIVSNYGVVVFKTIYYVFLSNYENKEILIYYFLIYFIKYKNKVFHMRNFKTVSKVLEIAKYVSRENHKIKGFLRFKELKNGILYAEMSPENNIIFILSSHFQKRLKNEFWVIKDVKRRIYSVYDKKNFYLVSEDDFNMLEEEYSEFELSIQDLWKSFYKTVGIESRKNDRCRQNFMPKKYWQYIIEVSEEK